MKIVLLSLRTVDNKVLLNYDLTHFLTLYFCHNTSTLKINLPTGTVYLNKYSYLNRYKIYSDGIYSFMAFQYKKPDTKLVLKMLIEHAKNSQNKTPHLLDARKLKKSA